jgi:hypothetical protein
MNEVVAAAACSYMVAVDSSGLKQKKAHHTDSGATRLDHIHNGMYAAQLCKAGSR